MAMTKIQTTTTSTSAPRTIEAIWEKFISKSGWNAGNVEEERKAIGTKIENKLDTIRKMESDVAKLRKDLDSIDDREKAASKYLKDAAAAMGKFATESVLLAAMYEEFPSAKPRLNAVAKAVDASLLAEVKSKLDREGLHFGQVSKMVAMDSGTLKKCLIQLVKTGQAITVGEKRGTKYILA